MTDASNLITVEQAAKDAGCSPSWLRKLAADGRIVARKVTSRCYLVDRRSVERFFSEPRKMGRPRK